jgi:hypothetical protein
MNGLDSSFAVKGLVANVLCSVKTATRRRPVREFILTESVPLKQTYIRQGVCQQAGNCPRQSFIDCTILFCGGMLRTRRTSCQHESVILTKASQREVPLITSSNSLAASFKPSNHCPSSGLNAGRNHSSLRPSVKTALAVDGIQSSALRLRSPMGVCVVQSDSRA